MISYLPLSHMAAQMIDIMAAVMIGHTVWFAQPDALKGSIKHTLLVLEGRERERKERREGKRRGRGKGRESLEGKEGERKRERESE